MSEFIWCIKNGDLETVKDMVEKKGYDVNQQLDGRTPLHYAADYGQMNVIKYLITNGSSLNAKDKHGITPLLAAIREGHTKCVQVLLENGASKNELAPDGSSYIENAEKSEIKELLY